tara:strand:+ start:594 stop:944 length:351 start_codon:yes stop_codon:yes gene_type:complete
LVVGESVGLLVGSAVGDSVVAVGESVGLLVGSAVGDSVVPVGESVGLLVGFAVGDSVVVELSGVGDSSVAGRPVRASWSVGAIGNLQPKESQLHSLDSVRGAELSKKQVITAYNIV